MYNRPIKLQADSLHPGRTETSVFGNNHPRATGFPITSAMDDQRGTGSMSPVWYVSRIDRTWFRNRKLVFAQCSPPDSLQPVTQDSSADVKRAGPWACAFFSTATIESKHKSAQSLRKRPGHNGRGALVWTSTFRSASRNIHQQQLAGTKLACHASVRIKFTENIHGSLDVENPCAGPEPF